MIYEILFFILALFLIFALLVNPISTKLFRRKICAICAAVSLTWLSLFVLKYLGYAIDILIIAILMGESITGIMYLFEDYVEKKNKKLLPLKILIILLGTLLVYLLLKWLALK